MVIKPFEKSRPVSNLIGVFEVSPVDGEVEPHQLSELSIAVAQHVGEVVGPVQVGVDGSDAAAFAVQVAVDLGSNAGQLGNQVHGVFIDKLREQTKFNCDASCSQDSSHWTNISILVQSRHTGLR